MKKYLLLILTSVILLGSCQKDDLSWMQEIESIKAELANQKKLIEALQANANITGIETNGDSYTIKFSNGQSITLTNGKTPLVTIGDNGNWFINGEDTGSPSRGSDGEDGKDGSDGITPTIEIVDGHWWINGKDTGIKAEGKDGMNNIISVIEDQGVFLFVFSDGNQFPIPTRFEYIVKENQSLTSCITDATKHFGSHVVVHPGEYNLEKEFLDYYGEDFFDSPKPANNGLVLKNKIHIEGLPGAKIVFHYTGNNEQILKYFSPINSGSYGFTLEGIEIQASNCRYAIHDERGGSNDYYTNIYRRCNIEFSVLDNKPFPYGRCIGGGLGKHGNITIENCIFNVTDMNEFVSYHNNADPYSQSLIVVKDNYFKNKGYFRLSWYGSSEMTTTAMVHGNSFGSHILERAETSNGTSPIKNTEVIEWNNIYR